MVSNIEEPIHYVYALLDPRKSGPFVYGEFTFEFEPFYVGKGHGNRAWVHLKTHSLRRDTHKVNKIKSIHRECEREVVVIMVAEHMNAYDAYQLEADVIDVVGKSRDGGPLTNTRDGGMGPLEFKIQHPHRSKSEALTGKHLTEEHRRNIGLSGLGRVHSEEEKQRRNESLTGLVRSEEACHNLSIGHKKKYADNPELKQAFVDAGSRGRETQRLQRIEKFNQFPNYRILIPDANNVFSIEVPQELDHDTWTLIKIDADDFQIIQDYKWYVNKHDHVVEGFRIEDDEISKRVIMSKLITGCPQELSVGYRNDDRTDLTYGNLYIYVGDRAILLDEVLNQRSQGTEIDYEPFRVLIHNESVGPFTRLDQVLIASNRWLNKRKTKHLNAWNGMIEQATAKYPGVMIDDLADLTNVPKSRAARGEGKKFLKTQARRQAKKENEIASAAP